MRKILVLLFIAQLMALLSCNKATDNTPSNSMNDLKIPDGFDWTTNLHLKINVNVEGLSEGATLALYNLNGEVIDKQSVYDDHALFEFQTNDITDTLRLYAPESRKSKYFTADSKPY